jgi:hypothetical protein
MKKIILTITACFALLAMTTAQCAPDKQFYSSATIELTSDWGMIIQAGMTGQISPLSIHAGIKAREFVPADTNKNGINQSGVMPRLEIGYRIVEGVHINVGIAQQKDVSVTAYKRLGAQTAIYGRAMYDGSVVFGMGLKVVFYKE